MFAAAGLSRVPRDARKGLFTSICRRSQPARLRHRAAADLELLAYHPWPATHDTFACSGSSVRAYLRESEHHSVGKCTARLRGDDVGSWRQSNGCPSRAVRRRRARTSGRSRSARRACLARFSPRLDRTCCNAVVLSNISGSCWLNRTADNLELNRSVYRLGLERKLARFASRPISRGFSRMRGLSKPGRKMNSAHSSAITRSRSTGDRSLYARTHASSETLAIAVD